MYLNTHEAAKILHISPENLLYYIKKDLRQNIYKRQGRRWMIPASEMIWLKQFFEEIH